MQLSTSRALLAVVGAGASSVGCDDRDAARRTDDAMDARPVSQAVIAHRGASGYAPEHTFAAYDLAIELGADYIEQDIGMTSDGVLVCLHDDTLDRTARGDPVSCSGPVSERTLAQVKTCDVGSWFNEDHPDLAKPAYLGLTIPTLEEVFERYGTDASYYIETKTIGAASPMEEELHRLIDDHGLREAAAVRHQVLVQSFDPASLDRMRAIDSELPLVQLLLIPPSEAQLDGLAAFAFGIGPPAGATTAELVARAHARGLAVHPYTVNDAAEIESMAELCVDGMFTNFPDRHRSVVDAGGLRCPDAIR